MPNWTNVSTIKDMFTVPNTNTGGNFYMAIMFMIVIVVLITMSSFGIEIGLLTAGFVGLVTSLFLAYMGLLAWQFVLIFLGLLIALFLYIVWSSNRDNV